MTDTIATALKWPRAILAAWSKMLDRDVSFGPRYMKIRVPMGFVVIEAISCALLCVMGADLCWAILVKRWLLASFASGATAFLFTSTLLNHLTARSTVRLLHKLNVQQLNFAKAIVEENERLRRVAIAAETVRLSIESGFVPDLDMLNRYLAALHYENSPTIN